MIISVDSKSRNFNWSEFLAPAGAKTGYCQLQYLPLIICPIIVKSILEMIALPLPPMLSTLMGNFNWGHFK